MRDQPDAAPAAPRAPGEARPTAVSAAPARQTNTIELGQGLVEYALIIFLVAIVVIAILFLLGPQIGNVFSSIYSSI